MPVRNPFDDVAPQTEAPPVTVEQAAWVLARVAEGIDEPGSFRELIYDRMGFGPEAYTALLSAGGMQITNAFYELARYRKAAAERAPATERR